MLRRQAGKARRGVYFDSDGRPAERCFAVEERKTEEEARPKRILHLFFPLYFISNDEL